MGQYSMFLLELEIIQKGNVHYECSCKKKEQGNMSAEKLLMMQAEQLHLQYAGRMIGNG